MRSGLPSWSQSSCCRSAASDRRSRSRQAYRRASDFFHRLTHALCTLSEGGDMERRRTPNRLEQSAFLFPPQKGRPGLANPGKNFTGEVWSQPDHSKKDWPGTRGKSIGDGACSMGEMRKYRESANRKGEGGTAAALFSKRCKEYARQAPNRARQRGRVEIFWAHIRLIPALDLSGLHTG